MADSKKNKKTVSFTIDEELYNEAKKRAENESRTVSNYLCFLVKKDIDKSKK